MHKEGWVFFISSLILSIITFPFFPIIGFFLLIISLYIFYFFRDPIRTVPDENFVMSFSMLLNLVEASNADSKELLWKFVKKYKNDISESKQIIFGSNRARRARNYFGVDFFSFHQNK